MKGKREVVVDDILRRGLQTKLKKFCVTSITIYFLQNTLENMTTNKFSLFPYNHHTLSVPLSSGAALFNPTSSNHDTPTLLNASLPIYLPPSPFLSHTLTLLSFSYTLKICNFFANAILTQSGCALLHCKLFTSASALYANIGSSTLRRDICVKSHISA